MSAKSDFIIPAFLNKDKSSKVQAVNIVNDEHIKEFMETPSEDEVILVDDKDIFAFKDDFDYHPEEETIKSLNKEKVSDAQLKDVARMARALRPEEIVTVLDNIPINYIYDKIGQELEKNRKFTEAIMQATDIINKD